MKTFATKLCLVALLSLGPAAFGQILPQGPTVGFTGSLTVADPDNNARLVPGVFTWESEVKLTASGWAPLEGLYIYLFGPLNTPGIEPTYRQMRDTASGIIGGTATFFTDGAGKM